MYTKTQTRGLTTVMAPGSRILVQQRDHAVSGTPDQLHKSSPAPTGPGLLLLHWQGSRCRQGPAAGPGSAPVVVPPYLRSGSGFWPRARPVIFRKAELKLDYSELSPIPTRASPSLPVTLRPERHQPQAAGHLPGLRVIWQGGLLMWGAFRMETPPHPQRLGALKGPGPEIWKM